MGGCLYGNIGINSGQNNLITKKSPLNSSAVMSKKEHILADLIKFLIISICLNFLYFFILDTFIFFFFYKYLFYFS